MSAPQQPRVRVVRQDDYREGYANSVQVRVSLWDFFLQFGVIAAQSNEEVQLDAFQGVYLSPQQAKALHMVLSENLKQYEQAFGAIKIDPNKVQQPTDAIQ